MMTPPTCGDLFATLTDTLYPPHGRYHALLLNAPHGWSVFAAHALGFLHGQAEKVYNGACLAFMSRPVPTDWFDWGTEAMRLITAHYGLRLVIDGERGELWGLRNAFAEDVLRLINECPPNSPEWHRRRARLCGIRDQEVDIAYHERQHATQQEPL